MTTTTTPAPIVFMDTETLGLDPLAPVWEFAAIRRDAGYAAFTIAHDPGKWLDELPEKFAADYRARYDPDEALPEWLAAAEIFEITRGAHIVGAVPNFDTERLALLLRRNGYEPAWHYHLIDVETMAVGYLAALGHLIELPWKSDDLSRAVGVDPDRFDRHTAHGDVLWTMAQYDAITDTESPWMMVAVRAPVGEEISQ